MSPSRTDLEYNPTTANTLPVFHDVKVKVPKTRNTVRATPSQLSKLNKVFQDTTRPSKGVRDSLAELTGLTPDWISSWFMRQRKKEKSVRYKPESSQSETMGHMLGIPELAGPRQPPITSKNPKATIAASSSSNSGLGTSWPSQYSSASSAPVLTPSISTAHAILSLPGLNRNYIQIQTTINNPPFWHVFPPSHASTVTGQSTIMSTASSSSLRNSGDGPHPSNSYQVMPYVSQNSHLHKSIHSDVPLGKEVPAQPQSSYAFAHPSGPAATNKPGRSALFECVLDPQLDSRSLRNTTPEGYSTSHTSHNGELSAGVIDEKRIPSPSRRKCEGDAGGNAAQGGTWHFEPTQKLLNDGVVLKSESFAAKTEVTTLKTTVNETGAVVSTPTSETKTAISLLCQGESGSSPGSDIETTSESMSEAEAWKKAKEDPDFEMFLKMAGVHGNFELTDNGLVLKK